MLKTKEERDYAPDGVTYLSKNLEVTYSKKNYNNKDYLFQSELKSVSNSKNEQVIQKIKYPLDYVSSGDDFGLGITQLKSKNVLNVAVEKFQFIQDQAGNNKRYTAGALNKFHSDKPLLKRSYSFQPSNTVSTFTESAISNGSFVYDQNYKPSLNFTKYDMYGNILEQNEEADLSESYIWDYNNTIPVAQVVNATCNEIAYTSFEADGQGNWGYNTPGIIAGPGITGKKYFDISQGGMWINSTTQNPTISSSKKYVVSLWAKGATPGINVNHPGGGSDILLYDYSTPKITIGDWKYFEVVVENAIGVGIWKWGNTGPSYVDEVRLFPLNSKMTSYTFEPLVGMTSQCDPNSRIVYYEYDNLQRLKVVRDQYGNVVKTYEYNYKQ